jgi:Tfp pilus assembly protein PilN
LSTLDQKQNPQKKRISEKNFFLPKEEADRIKQDAAALNHLILLDGFPWHQVLNDLEKRTPPEITILELVSGKNFGGVKITGETHLFNVITLFLNNLEQSNIFKHTVLENFSVSQEAESSQDRENNLKITFEIKSRLNDRFFL